MPLPHPAPPHAARAHLLVALWVACLGLGLCALLNHYKFQSALEAAARTRMAVPVAAVREAVQATLVLGLPLSSAVALPELLARERQADAAIHEITVFEPGGRVLFSTTPGARAVPAAWTAAARTPGGWQVHEPDGAVLGAPLLNAFDLPQGQVAVRYGLAAEAQALAALRGQLLALAAAGLAGTLLLAALLLRALPRRSPALLILLAVLLGLLAVSAATQRAFEAGLRPQLERKAGVLGASVGKLVARALQHQITLDQLVGVEAHLAELRHQHPELAYLALRDGAGVTRFASGQPEATPGLRVPIQPGAPALGTVEVSVGQAYLRRTLLEAALDLVVVFVVAAVLARELLHYLATAGPGAPQGTARLARLRVPLLLFMAAEELTRALVPGYARQLLPADAAWAPDVLAGLPIVVFMLVVALGQPVLAVWSERVGLRRALGLGAALGALGLGGAALAPSLAAFLGWRALCGLGYAMVFVAAQGYVIAHTTAAERTRGFAGFVSAILVAGVCGPPLGGLLADHLGARWGFGLAAAVALLALAALRQLPGALAAPVAPASLAPRDLARLLGQPGFRRVALLAALPAKLILASFCFYLVPLYLAAQGAPAATTGRAQMVYALALLALLPLATRWAEAGVSQARLVGVGLCVSALGGFGLLFWQGVWPVFGALLLLGAGQGLSIAAQSSLLATVCAAEAQRHGHGALFGFYRLFERLGNAAGPLVAGLLVLALGQGGAFAAIAGAVLACGLLFLALTRGARA